MTTFLSRYGSSGDILKACLLVAASFVAYWPAVDGQFIWDDNQNLARNQSLRSVDGLVRSWYKVEENYHFYPLMYSSFWIEYQFWKDWTSGYHLTNVFLHAMGAVFLFRLLKILAVPGAWVAAAVFALHPIQVESVAWITERKNVLSGFLFLASLLAYVRFRGLGAVDAAQDRPAAVYAVSLFLFVFALMSKTTACTLPAAALLLIWWKTNRLDWKDVLLLVPFFGLGIAFGLLTAYVERNTSFVGTVTALDLSFIERCLIAGRAIWFYAGKLVVPAPLMFVYPRWQPDIGDWVQVLYPLGVIAVAATLWFARFRIGRGPLVGALCYGGTLFPALSFFDVYFMRFSFVANHFSYLSSMALIALVVAVVHSAIERVRIAWSGPIVAAIVIAALSGMTWSHSRAFLDEESLWTDTIEKNPDAWVAHNNLGSIFLDRGDADAAVRHYKAALAVNPNFFESHHSLMKIFHSAGDLDRALIHGRRALNLAAMGRDKMALHNNIAQLLEQSGDPRSAMEHYRAAMLIDPERVELQFNYASALEAGGLSSDALRHFENANRLKPDWPEPLLAMARILHTHPDPEVRDPDRARELERRAEQLKSDPQGGGR